MSSPVFFHVISFQIVLGKHRMQKHPYHRHEIFHKHIRWQDHQRLKIKIKTKNETKKKKTKIITWPSRANFCSCHTSGNFFFKIKVIFDYSGNFFHALHVSKFALVTTKFLKVLTTEAVCKELLFSLVSTQKDRECFLLNTCRSNQEFSHCLQ